MRDFAEFMGRQGYQVYVPLTKSAPQKRNAHIPYIFTQKQLYKFSLKGYRNMIMSNKGYNKISLLKAAFEKLVLY